MCNIVQCYSGIPLCTSRQFFFFRCVWDLGTLNLREREQRQNRRELGWPHDHTTLSGSRCLTWVAERLALTLGLFGVLILVFARGAVQALWLQTGAQRRHASACCSDDNAIND